METALNNDLEGAQLKKESLLIFKNLSYDYLNLNRLDDAAKILEEARAKKMDVPLLANSYQLAFVRDDGSQMARCVSAASGDSSIEPGLLANQADTEAFHGHLAKARDYSRKAVDASVVADAKEDAAGWKATAALREAEFGNAAAAVQDAKDALALSSSRNVQVAAALAFARAGDQRQAERIVADLGTKFPLDSLLTRYWLPTIHAALHLSQKDAALALIDLSVTAPYELGGSVPPFASGATLYPVYLRGLALLETNQADKAAAEFQKFFDHRGLVWNFPLGALAHYQLGRAYAASGDSAKAKAAYQDFLSLWHDADTGIPILEHAKVEYNKLR
jgi:tetratricopeptide (TPR) repeat protein